MPAEDLVIFLHTDLSAISRGRSVAAGDLADRLPVGAGWVPANAALTPFGGIADTHPWGSVGDVRLLPDPATEVRVSDLPGVSPLHFFQCDVVNLDGTGWPACPRVFLKQVLKEFDDETGLQVVASFEHEFYLLPGTSGGPAGAPFSMDAFRQADRFGTLLVGSLRQACVEPENFMPEYGRGQYEITCRQAPALQAADRAVAVREVVREVARSLGLKATFAPVVEPGVPASGVHIHLSLLDAAGRPATHDPASELGMSAAAANFAGGVLGHLGALCAFAAPSMVSYLRLTPHNWSSSFAGVANDREAAIRVPGLKSGPGLQDHGAQFNLEFRFPDAAACPHMVLAILIRAGLDGVRSSTRPFRENGGESLPTRLEEAMAALDADAAVKSWLPAQLLDTYRAIKATEMAHLRDRNALEACREYVDVY